MPGTHPGNWLKKFVRCEDFYNPVETNDEEEEEERIDENKVKEKGNKVVDGGESVADDEPIGFEIRLPTLTVAQQSEYIHYEEDDEGNILRSEWWACM